MIKNLTFPLPSGCSFTVYELSRNKWSYDFCNTPPGGYPNFYTAKDAIKSAIRETGLPEDEYMKFLQREADRINLALLVLKKQEDK